MRAQRSRRAPPQREVSCHINFSWVRKIPFFDVDDVREKRDFTMDLTMAIVPEVFPPQEFIIRSGEKSERMCARPGAWGCCGCRGGERRAGVGGRRYIVTRGLVVKPGRIFGLRQSFGEASARTWWSAPRSHGAP